MGVFFVVEEANTPQWLLQCWALDWAITVISEA